MNSKRELHQLYSQFVRIWKSGEKAKLNLRSENGAVKACLEINLGNPHAAPTDASTATSGRPQDHEARRARRHRSSASKARSRARAARHQAAKTKSTADNTAPVLPPPHSGLNQGVRLSYYNFQIPPRTLCTISTDCFAETPVTVSFDHILCTFWCIHMRRLTHQMTNH